MNFVNAVECLLHVHKRHADRLGKLPSTLEYPVGTVELVQCSTARTKTTLLLLKPRFDYRPVSKLMVKIKMAILSTIEDPHHSQVETSGEELVTGVFRTAEVTHLLHTLMELV
ncbi:hypothetical protein AMECASPLE_038065 [Ameca splendens]|uniref:Uncharacterized protein n=1 Tax=Ameca splendens TaxID=208324 RepID=A0ABV0YJ79_9TELE